MRFTLARRVPNANRLPRRRGKFFGRGPRLVWGKESKTRRARSELATSSVRPQGVGALCVRRGTHTENRRGADAVNDSNGGEDAERRSQNTRRSLLDMHDMEDIGSVDDGIVFIASPLWLRGETS